MTRAMAEPSPKSQRDRERDDDEGPGLHGDSIRDEAVTLTEDHGTSSPNPCTIACILIPRERKVTIVKKLMNRSLWWGRYPR
jgi:hypothetical protein